jgi:hypothetical protein
VLVDEALERAEFAATELRELAQGSCVLADRIPIPVTLDVGAERFDASAEATAYFVVAEALTSVAKSSRTAGWS